MDTFYLYFIFIFMKEDKLKYIGKTFGKLTIKEIIPFYKKVRNTQQIDYRCKIHCGYCDKENIASLYRVITYKTKNCGCQNLVRLKGLDNKKCKNLTEQRFGNLVAKEIDKSKTSRIHWKCLCDCGNFISVATKHLTGHLTKSCGCRHFLKGKESNSWKGYEEISGQYWGRVIRGAKSRKLDFSITLEEAWEKALKQNKKCALSGVDLIFGRSSNRNASLDRIDSSKGYTPENIQWVDKKVNEIKSDMDEEEFIIWCKRISNYRGLTS